MNSKIEILIALAISSLVFMANCNLVLQVLHKANCLEKDLHTYLQGEAKIEQYYLAT